MLNLNPDDLTRAWSKGTLTPGTVYAYLSKNLFALNHMTPHELEHVSTLCFSIYEWSVKRKPVGDFLTAVIENNLREAVFRADGVNQKQLWIYVCFLYNIAPAGWKEKKDEKNS